MDRFWRALYWPSIGVTVACLALGFAAGFGDWPPDTVVWPLLIGLGVVCAALFLAVLFDRKIHRAVRFLMADEAWTRKPGRLAFILLPPYADRWLMIINRLCILGILILGGRHLSFDQATPVLLVFAGFWVNTMVIFGSLRWSKYAKDPSPLPPVL
jgi:hypothetical protein